MDLTRILISVVDSQGNNLLNPPSSVAGNIKVFYLVNGKENLVGRPGGVIKEVDKYVYELLPNATPTESLPVTIMDFGLLGSDKIKCQIVRDDGVTLVTKVWVNGEVKWDNSGPRTITIVK